MRGRGQTFLFSRRGRIFNQRFPRLAKARANIPGKSFVLDGEIIGFDERGGISFARIEEPDERRTPLFFFAFDLLKVNGKSMPEMPARARRRRLESLARNRRPRFLCPGGHFQIQARS